MKSKWVAILLVASVVINLLLIGFLIGSRSVGPPGADPTRGYPRWARGLPEERMDVLRPVIRQHMQNMRPALGGLRRGHRNLKQALTAEPFDPEALEQVLADMRAENDRMQTLSHTSFAEFVGHLTAAERKQLAADMSRRRHHKPPRPPAHDRPGG